MERLYTQKEVNRIFLDTPRETLAFWAREGLVEWANEREDGRGIHREYHLNNLYQFGIVKELSSLNFSVGDIGLIMHNMFSIEGPKAAHLRSITSEASSSLTIGWLKPMPGPEVPEYMFDRELWKDSFSEVMKMWLVIEKPVTSSVGGIKSSKDDPALPPRIFGFSQKMKKQDLKVDLYEHSENLIKKMELNKPVSYIVISLPVIAAYVNNRIKQEGLD